MRMKCSGLRLKRSHRFILKLLILKIKVGQKPPSAVGKFPVNVLCVSRDVKKVALFDEFAAFFNYRFSAIF